MSGISWAFDGFKLLWEFAFTFLVTWCFLLEVSCEKFLWDLRRWKLRLPWKTDVFLRSNIFCLTFATFWVWHLRPFTSLSFQAISPICLFTGLLFQANGTTIPSSRGAFSYFAVSSFFIWENLLFLQSLSPISFSMKPLGITITGWVWKITRCGGKNMVSQAWDGAPIMLFTFVTWESNFLSLIFRIY